MAQYVTKQCAHFSSIIAFYGIYFFIIVPLVWSILKPEVFDIRAKDHYHLLFWCTALLLFIVIILGAWLARKLCCSSKVQNEYDKNVEYHEEVPITATNGISMLNNKPLLREEDKDSENDEVFYRSAECLRQILLSDNSTQTDEPLTPREKFFHDLVETNKSDPSSSSTNVRRTSGYSSLSGYYDQSYLQNSYLLPMDELTKHNRDLYTFLKRLNSRNDKPTIVDITKEFLDREQKKTTDFLKIQSRAYLKRQSQISPRSTLKSEVHINVDDH